MARLQQQQIVAAMTDAKLEKELAFAEGFAPATTPEEQSWLCALRTEHKRRRGGG